VLADDLLGLVALDPLRAGIPGADAAGQVELANGVIDYRVDELTVAPLAFDQGLVCNLPVV